MVVHFSQFKIKSYLVKKYFFNSNETVISLPYYGGAKGQYLQIVKDKNGRVVATRVIQTEGVQENDDNNYFDSQNSDENDGKIDQKMIDAIIHFYKMIQQYESSNSKKNQLRNMTMNSTSEDVNEIDDGDVSNAESSVAEAKPHGIAVVGKYGLAASKPLATAITGDHGLALAQPIATAIAGLHPADALLSIHNPSQKLNKTHNNDNIKKKNF